MAVQHVVLFRFATPLGPDEAAEMRRRIAGWPDRIGGFRRLRFGTDLGGGKRARGHQFLLLTEHDGVAELRAYQQHPDHLAFTDWIFSRGCEVLAFDYELDVGTVLAPEPEPHPKTVPQERTWQR